MRLDRKGFEPSYFKKYHILNITRLPISPPIYFLFTYLDTFITIERKIFLSKFNFV